MSERINKAFLTNVAEILEQAKQNAKAAIDVSMVYAYFEIGRLIVEEEQNGGQRAAYGKYVIPELSKYLTSHMGRGFSVTNLKQMRKFYQVYAKDQIGQTISDQFSNLPAVSTGRKFPLSWSHYNSGNKSLRFTDENMSQNESDNGGDHDWEKYRVASANAVLPAGGKPDFCPLWQERAWNP